ncbi:MAG: hypothetical protein AB8B94_11870, partial [Hyphomicrobiales bacterium]
MDGNFTSGFFDGGFAARLKGQFNREGFSAFRHASAFVNLEEGYDLGWTLSQAINPFNVCLEPIPDIGDPISTWCSRPGAAAPNPRRCCDTDFALRTLAHRIA